MEIACTDEAMRQLSIKQSSEQKRIGTENTSVYQVEGNLMLQIRLQGIRVHVLAESIISYTNIDFYRKEIKTPYPTIVAMVTYGDGFGGNSEYNLQWQFDQCTAGSTNEA